MIKNLLLKIFVGGSAIVISISISTVCLAAAGDTLLIRTSKLPRTTYVGNMPLASRDPFNWPSAQLKRFAAQERMANADPFTGLKLNGIVWNSKLPLAIINNVLLRTGDAIKGSQVVDINKNKVTLKKSGLTHELQMEEKIINLNADGEQG